MISVLIVGAGPIGLTLALELAWRGVDCTIIDQTDGSIDLPRGAMVSVRTMEFCRRWGIAERVVNAGFPQDYKLNMVYCTSLAGHLLERDDYPSQRDQKTPASSPEKRQWCPQLLFDPLLARAAAEHPHVTMRYLCKLESFEQTADEVIAHTVDVRTGEPATIRARYMVACDGSASFVREAAGIRQTGRVLGYSINIFFRSPHLLRAHDKGEAERYLFIGTEGTWGNITVVDGRGSWRLTVIGSSDKMDLSQFDARAQVERAIGRNDVPFDLIAVKPWRRSELMAEQFRLGRIFLAGDAAHTMSPTGGFGMNTGVIDAVNLGWKLQAMLDGWGGDKLLDSYETEQRPVIDRNARASTHISIFGSASGTCARRCWMAPMKANARGAPSARN
jgi:2-polyprenyl-6-methoxyphenol hydroxylase-like FAD-dependent oxidoreductase